MNTENLTPEEILALQEKAAEQATTQQSTIGGDVMQVLGEVADVTLEALSDAASGTGDVLCAVAGGIGDVACGIGNVAGDILGALFD